MSARGTRLAISATMILLVGSSACRNTRVEAIAPSSKKGSPRVRNAGAGDSGRLYLAAESREPPDTAFRSDLAASSGAEALTAIVDALSKVKDDFEVSALLRLLSLISSAREEQSAPTAQTAKDEISYSRTLLRQCA